MYAGWFPGGLNGLIHHEPALALTYGLYGDIVPFSGSIGQMKSVSRTIAQNVQCMMGFGP